LEDLIGVAEMEETRLRNCYAEAIELSSDVFVKMLLLGAAFVIKGLTLRILLRCLMMRDVDSFFSRKFK
jgi:hypothetical protein